MRYKLFLFLVLLCLTAPLTAQTHIGTYQVAQSLLENTQPKCAFRPDIKAGQFKAWQRSVSRAMDKLMQHPTLPKHIQATLVSRQHCNGYMRDLWQLSPLPGCTVQFTVLTPSTSSPRPAVMCIPGSGMTMANLCDTTDHAHCFATRIVREGYVAVAVENACAGTQQDEALNPGSFDYDTPSRLLLEIGWSWLGYTSYTHRCILQWMKEQDFIRRNRICVAGFSLGTEPLMVLGALDKEIYAFAYNDFLCNTQERALVLTKTDGRYRPFPNSIRHLIPRWWQYFNFPDVVASLAPRHLILTEGGMDRDFNLLRRSYKLSGHPENLELHHYAKFADDANRQYIEQLPSDIDRDTYFRLANVDPPSHYFKSEHIIPWLHRIFNQ